jgi:preprotein translocase subunit SecG
MSTQTPNAWRRLLDRFVPPEVWAEKRWIGWLLLAGVIIIALFILLSLVGLIVLIDSLARHGAGDLGGQAGFEAGGPRDFSTGIAIARWWLVGIWLVVPLSLFRVWWHFSRGEGPRGVHADLEAAQAGDGAAAHRLGLHYRHRDPGSARAWLARAAHAGVTEAMVELAQDLREGRGGPRDLASAHGWLHRAANGGDPRAKALLAEVEAQLDDRHSQRGI